MSGFETRFRAEDDAEQIRAAFYGFIGAHAAEVDGDAHISTEIDTQGSKLRVRLWSAAAMDAFLSDLHASAGAGHRACHE
ncbi:MAG TPA: hypothetical protein VF474_10640 [Phenylobacterium sp.]